jgi:hypothetical protein
VDDNVGAEGDKPLCTERATLVRRSRPCPRKFRRRTQSPADLWSSVETDGGLFAICVQVQAVWLAPRLRRRLGVHGSPAGAQRASACGKTVTGA